MKNRKPTDLPDSLKRIDVKAILRSRGVYLKQKANRDLKKAAMPLAKELMKPKAKVEVTIPQISPHFSNQDIVAYAAKQIHVVEVVENHLEKKIHQFIKSIEKNFLAHLEEEVAAKQKGYFTEENEQTALKQAQADFSPLMVSVATIAGQNALQLLKRHRKTEDDTYIPFAYREQITKNINKFTQSLWDTDREKLIDYVSQGIEDGDSIADMRTRISKDFDEYSKMQAERISRTEVMRVSNQASIDAWEQSGVVEGKQWVTEGATDECAEYDGDVITLKGSFYDSDSEFRDGDPPLHPNCKCVVIPIVEDVDKVYRPDNKALVERIAELESKLDKRTKAAKELMTQRSDDAVYIKTLERYLDIEND